MSAYDLTRMYFAEGAMRARITNGVEFRLREIWTLGNKEAGWRENDDQSPCVKEAWTMVGEYRRLGQMRVHKRGKSKIWSFVANG